jgi:hypothetical protein
MKKRQRNEQDAAPLLLRPRDQNADPAPLIATLARVALAVAQRRAARQAQAAQVNDSGGEAE